MIIALTSALAGKVCFRISFVNVTDYILFHDLTGALLRLETFHSGFYFLCSFDHRFYNVFSRHGILFLGISRSCAALRVIHHHDEIQHSAHEFYGNLEVFVSHTSLFD